MTDQFKVSGMFDRSRAHGTQLPDRLEEILPPARREEWKARPADHISIPSPVLRHTFFGRPDHAEFQKEACQVEQSEKAVTNLVRTRTEKEQAFVEHERALAKRENMQALIEQDRLGVMSDVLLARAALRHAYDHVTRQQNADQQAAVNDQRHRELEKLEYEAALARQQRILAEEQALAGTAKETAEFKAKAERAKAECELRHEESALAEAQRAADRYARRRFVDDESGDDPPAFSEALAQVSERERIRKAARARAAKILDPVGGDEEKLNQADRDRLEDIRSAEYRALKELDLTAATGTVFPQEEE